MPDPAPNSRPSAALPAAAADLPADLTLDELPTPEEFADALNVAKNAALDTLVIALSGRTDDGLPTREALFAAARILALSAHTDRLAAARPGSSAPARQVAIDAAPSAPRRFAPASERPPRLPAANGAAITIEPRLPVAAAAQSPKVPAPAVSAMFAAAATSVPATSKPAPAARTPALLQLQASTVPRNANARGPRPSPSEERSAPFLARRESSDLDHLRALLDPEAFLDSGRVPELDALLAHGPSP